MKYWKLSEDKKVLILKRDVMIGDDPTEFSYKINHKSIINCMKDDYDFGLLKNEELEEAREILNKLVLKA